VPLLIRCTEPETGYLRCKDAIESHLAEREKQLFDLPERICLFDLTNTYFEGQAAEMPRLNTDTAKRNARTASC